MRIWKCLIQKIILRKKEVEKISAAPNHEGAVAIDDPVKMYLKEIGSMRLLDSDEEIVLAKKVEKGSLPDATDEDKKEADDAKKELADRNLRLVVSIAKKISGTGSSVFGPDSGRQLRAS